MKKKSIEELRTELEDAKIREQQITHKMERLENRKRYFEKGEQKKRTHQLCNIGGVVEGVFPVASAMEQHLKEHQKEFMPGDTNARLIKEFLENFKGDYVCSKLLYKEALNHPYNELEPSISAIL